MSNGLLDSSPRRARASIVRRMRPAPDRIGPYRLRRPLGRGGFAPVWLAEEEYDGSALREVAVKLFFAPEGVLAASAAAAGWRDAILHEARALCRVEHPYVVRFYALHQDEALGVVGLGMEYVPGESLDVALARGGPLDPRDVVDAGARAAWALSAVHHAGLVHRDVKPGNLVRGHGGYKLIDFGIVAGAAGVETPHAAEAPPDPAWAAAPVKPPTPAASRVRFGTPGYVAPECLDWGEPASPASDLYALGVTLHRLATGALPLGAEALRARLPATPAGAALARLVERLLDPDPATRPRYAEWVARELEGLAGQAGLAGEAAPRRPPPRAAPGDVTVREVRRETTKGATSGPEEEPGGAGPPFVGRADALAAIERAAAEARRGNVVFVLITGPLGVGRSRLIEAGIARAGYGAGRVIRAACSPERSGPLRPLARATPGSSPHRRLRGAVDRALSAGAAAGAGDVESAIEGVEDAILRESEDAPILLALDDVQWADAQTLALCRLLVERAEAGGAGRVLVLCAARDEPSPAPPLRAFLGKVRATPRPRVKHVALGPLAPDEAAALAQSVCPVDADVERVVVRGSGGVPFFVVHALAAFRETGALVFREGAFRAADDRVRRGDVPGVADLLEARLGSWFEPGTAAERAALLVLAAVALHGGGIPAEVVVRAAGAGAEEALEVLAAARVLTVSGPRQEHGFAAEMVRQAALNLAQRRPSFPRVHRALLDAVAAGPGAADDAAFLASGYEALGDRAEACTWLGRALEGALAAGRFTEAAEIGDRLAALADGAEARAAAELAAVAASLRGRSYEDAQRRVDRLAARAAVLPEAAALRLRVHRLEAARGLNQPATDPTLAADADALGDLAIRCEARVALAGAAPPEEALARAGEAVALGAEAGPARELAARVLRMEVNYASGRCDLALAEADLERATALAEVAASAWQRIHLEGDLAAIEAERGRVGPAVERLRRLLAEADARGMRGERLRFSQNLAALLLRQDRAPEAAEAALHAADLAQRAGDPALRASALSLRADALCRCGRLAEALESAGAADGLQRARGDWMLALTLLRRAEILEQLGRAAEAAADARAALPLAEAHGERGLVAAATLWDVLDRARRGEAGADALSRALADAQAAGAGLRALTRGLVERASVALAERAA
jgi:hypothetical protein